MRAVTGLDEVRNQVQGAPASIAGERRSTLPEAITMAVPPPTAILAASTLVRMPPRDSSEPASPAMASISGVMRGTTGIRRARVAARRRGVEAVDVGEQHEAIGAGHGGDAGREAVIVAIADLGGRDRVVLVDDRNAFQLQKLGERVAGVEIAAALLGVAERDQDLRRGEAARAERIGPGMGEGDLADRGRGLARLQRQRALGQLRARCDRARWRRRRPR